MDQSPQTTLRTEIYTSEEEDIFYPLHIHYKKHNLENTKLDKSTDFNEIQEEHPC
jgi:hypothetical protein